MLRVIITTISLLFLCVVIFLFSIYLNGKNVKHISGKDTIESYGNGSFQITGRDSPNLSDLERRTTLEVNIKKYKLIGDNVYVYGKRGYTVVNIKSEVIKQCIYSVNDYWEKNERPKYGEKYIRLNGFGDFSQEEQEIFKNM